jgi:hypothetical protein
VLTTAPALHSLIIHECMDVEYILGFLKHNHVDLRKPILEYCFRVKNGTGLLTYIVAFYRDLEVLSLAGCHQLAFGDYHLIPRLKKLSELNHLGCEVHYVCVKVLETHVSICAHM